MTSTHFSVEPVPADVNLVREVLAGGGIIRFRRGVA
jgi:hypothetical protein